MSQHVSDQREEKILPETKLTSVKKPRWRVHSVGIPALFVLIGLALLLFTAQIIQDLTATTAINPPAVALAQPTQGTSTSTPQALLHATPTASPIPQPTNTLPFFAPSNMAAPPLALPTGHSILYQNETHIYLVSTTNMLVRPIYTPGYTYSQTVQPILTPSNQLLYSGNQGIWLTDPFVQQPLQIFQLDANMQVTSMVLSQDGKMVAWTTEPIDGNGQISLYAGTLTAPALITQQSNQSCPCLHLFSFLNGSSAQADTTVLLTDDHGSNGAFQYGLWALDLTNPTTTPELIMDSNSQQGPLAFAPYSNTLLYSANEEAVPEPTDKSVPPNVAALAYANSLSVTSLQGTPIVLGATQSILTVQKDLANSAQYRWVTTPTFSPDGGTLAYVEFSSDSQDPYDRHSALYTVQVSGSGFTLQVGKPQLIATSTVKLLELGPWLNSHVVTMYGDGGLYALDVQSGSATILTFPGTYLRVLGVIGNGLE